MAQIKDAAVLKAVAHPVRRRLLDVLRVDGPAMPSVLARVTGQAVANVSHHLRVLAEAGLIEEAPELARNRKEHWWRMPDRSISWNVADFTGDAADLAAADAAEALGLQRQVELTASWLGSPASRDGEWVDSAFSTDGFLRLSPAELAELSRELQQVIDRFRDRPEDPEREPVFVFSRGFPARP
ncbi:winged helix-turn-helix domain-containing protein [Nucisporomicrobium flavum]|jgi:DNA-binding transcriptional ArsR family regulator|uniref:winged helix-turn-helix domain-containing protein n=1 Tax=Nucisporomicrobium flavum TaxID=2785915 RepID=UPI0018F58756|nr:helix-turn-helix domain-containing protein [Nucisporomicrobium flavum]